MEKNTPSILKIIFGDYFSFFCILILLLVAGLSFYFFLTEGSRAGELVGLLVAVPVVVVVPLILLVMRIRLIRCVFSSGEKVQGKIERIRQNSSRGFAVNSRIVFSYRFKGRRYQKSRFLLSHEKFKTGQKVSIIADPDKPKRAFIRSAFTG